MVRLVELEIAPEPQERLRQLAGDIFCCDACRGFRGSAFNVQCPLVFRQLVQFSVQKCSYHRVFYQYQ
jgi:hypothetical protein